MTEQLLAPFPAFGGKRDVAPEIWKRLGRPKQYIEPFCFSAAILLAAPQPASLEVIGDINGFVANFWRAVIHQPGEVARWADYPVSHIDLGARHVWLMQQRERIGEALQDPNWPGDAQVAGWWLWGQCAWIGSGWCDWTGKGPVSSAGQGVQAIGQVPHVSSAGQGVQAIGQVPHVSNAGRGVQAMGKVPHVSNAGRGVQAMGKVPHVSDAGHPSLWTTCGMVADMWLRKIAARMERVRMVHGDWTRCLNHHYGSDDTAVVLDPPYEGYEGVYRAGPVAQAVGEWCRENEHLRVVLCGHRGDYNLPKWEVFEWTRSGNTYGGTGTKDAECIWFSPACLKVRRVQQIAIPGF